MVDNTTIKKLRMENKFSQTMLAKAMSFDPVTISNYENGKRSVTVDTMERIANIFGRTLSLELIDKASVSRNVELYKDKTPEEIIELDEKDMIDYIFVKESDETLKCICNLDSKLYELLNYEQIKEILSEHIHRCLKADKAILYNLLTHKYPLYDYNTMDFLCSIHEVIKESMENMSEDTRYKVEKDLKFLKIELDNDVLLTIDNIQFLDSELNDIGVKREDVEVGTMRDRFSKQVVQVAMEELNYDYNSDTDIDNYLRIWNKENELMHLSYLKDEDEFQISCTLPFDSRRQLNKDARVLGFFTLNPVIRFKY